MFDSTTALAELYAASAAVVADLDFFCLRQGPGPDARRDRLKAALDAFTETSAAPAGPVNVITLAATLPARPMAEWEAAIDALTPEQRQLAYDLAEASALAHARLAGYLFGRTYHRGAEPAHVSGVRTQNRIATKLRRAFGYTNAKHDLQF